MAATYKIDGDLSVTGTTRLTGNLNVGGHTIYGANEINVKIGDNQIPLAGKMFNQNAVYFGSHSAPTTILSSEARPRFDTNGDYLALVSDTAKMTETTWSALKALRDGGNLVPGMQYRITDYQCITVQENTSSANHQFDIIVTADAPSALNENARACLHAGDTYFANSDLSAWRLKYCLDNDGKYLWSDGYGIVVNGIVYYRAEPGDYNNVDYPFRWINASGSGCYSVSETPSVSDTVYNGPVADHAQAIGTISDFHQAAGKGVVYEMIDEFNNKASYDFKNILFTSGAIAIDGARFLRSPSDDIVINGTNYYAWKSGSTIYYTTFEQTAAENIYLFDDTGTRIQGLDVYGVAAYSDLYTFNSVYSGGVDASLNSNPNERGFRCYNNIIKSDFDIVYRLNFNVFYNSSGNGIHDNIFNENCSGNTMTSANVENNIFDKNCCGNIFKSLYRCTFGQDCSANAGALADVVMGASCTNNMFKYLVSSRLGFRCVGIKSAGAAPVTGLVMGDECQSISFGMMCRYNSIGNKCSNIYIGNQFQYNALGNNCSNISIGNFFTNNTIGNNCSYITFGDSSATINYCQNIKIEDGCKYLYINSADTTASTGNKLQNVYVGLAVNGSSDANRLTITVPDRALAYETRYEMAGSTTVTL